MTGRGRLLLDSRGFTLLEILVAFVILAVTVTVILQLFSANLKTLWMSDDYVTATTLADVKMREVLEIETLREDTSSETTPQGYRMDVTVTEALEGRTRNLAWKMFEVVLKVSWQKEGKNRSISVSTLRTAKRQVVR
ncbi:MAG: prepilin-type N-terminal cleavage/methylation domain-containing protein [Syntrophorhabdaceae bacterium]|nr:prepilin-type N-terminal cleavage/methylation domain-containing protein [Syntrophorhabdaceae bacterium]